jgi:hypothetical protein
MITARKRVRAREQSDARPILRNGHSPAQASQEVMMSLATISKLVFAVSLTAFSGLAVTTSARAGGAYGPDTCQQGYVWREAFPGDHTCVRPSQRGRAAIDNSQAGNRVSASDRSYGSETCEQGYVWRESVPGDTVCVTPAERAHVSRDNARAPGRYQ